MKLVVVGFLCISILAGCGKTSRGGNVSVNSDGTCSHQYILDNNEIYNAGIAEDTSRTKKACDVFRSRHARTASCSAVSESTLQSKLVEAETMYKICEGVDEALAPEKVKLSPPIHDVPTLIGEGIVNTDAAKLKFTILDPDKLALVRSESGRFLENGIVVNAAPLGKSDAFCIIATESVPPKRDAVYFGKAMTDETLPNINHVKITAVDPQGDDLTFLCGTSSSLKISLKDIQEALKGIVDVTDEP